MTIGAPQAAALYGAIGDFVRSARAIGARNRTELGAAGTPLAVLKLLLHGDARPSDIAAALHVGPSVVSRTIAPLERSGLIVRVTDPDDARAARLSLTEAGRARLHTLQGTYVEQVSAMLSDWSDADAEQAVAIMNRLEQAILTSDPAPEAQRRLLDEAQIPMLEDEPESAAGGGGHDTVPQLADSRSG